MADGGEGDGGGAVQFASAEEEAAYWREECETIKAAFDDFQASSKELEDELDSELSRVQAECTEQQTQIVKLKSDLTAAQAHVSRLTAELASSASATLQLRGDVADLLKANRGLETRLDQTEAELRQTSAAADALRDQLQEVQEEAAVSVEVARDGERQLAEQVQRLRQEVLEACDEVARLSVVGGGTTVRRGGGGNAAGGGSGGGGGGTGSGGGSSGDTSRRDSLSAADGDLATGASTPARSARGPRGSLPPLHNAGGSGAAPPTQAAAEASDAADGSAAAAGAPGRTPAEWAQLEARAVAAEALEQRALAAEADLQELETTVADTAGQMEGLRDSLLSLARTLDSVTAELDTSRAENGALRAALAEARAHEDAASHECATAAEELVRANGEAASLSHRYETALAELTAIRGQAAGQRDAIAASESALAKHREQVRQLEHEVALVHKQMGDAVRTASAQVAALQSRNTALQQQVDTMHAFHRLAPALGAPAGSGIDASGVGGGGLPIVIAGGTGSSSGGGGGGASGVDEDAVLALSNAGTSTGATAETGRLVVPHIVEASRLVHAAATTLVGRHPHQPSHQPAQAHASSSSSSGSAEGSDESGSATGRGTTATTTGTGSSPAAPVPSAAFFSSAASASFGPGSPLTLALLSASGASAASASSGAGAPPSATAVAGAAASLADALQALRTALAAARLLVADADAHKREADSVSAAKALADQEITALKTALLAAQGPLPSAGGTTSGLRSPQAGGPRSPQGKTAGTGSALASPIGGGALAGSKLASPPLNARRTGAGGGGGVPSRTASASSLLAPKGSFFTPTSSSAAAAAAASGASSSSVVMSGVLVPRSVIEEGMSALARDEEEEGEGGEGHESTGEGTGEVEEGHEGNAAAAAAARLGGRMRATGVASGTPSGSAEEEGSEGLISTATLRDLMPGVVAAAAAADTSGDLSSRSFRGSPLKGRPLSPLAAAAAATTAAAGIETAAAGSGNGDVSALAASASGASGRVASLLRENAHLLSQLYRHRNNVTVYCRLRPANEEELRAGPSPPPPAALASPGGAAPTAGAGAVVDGAFSPGTGSGGTGSVHPHLVVDAVSDTEMAFYDRTRRAWRPFAFDRVFPPTASQADVFREVAPLAQAVVDGYNAAVLAHGITSSGKTHTMQGPASDPGINARIIAKIFQLAALREKTTTFRVRVSMLEIYNEELRDLLLPPGPPGSTPPKLEIRTVAAPPLPSSSSTPGSASTPGGSAGAAAAAASAAAASSALADGSSYTHIPYLTSVEVTSPQEVLAVLARGNAIRATAATNMHEHSSRSHCVLRVEVEGTPVVLAPGEAAGAAAAAASAAGGIGGGKAMASTRSFFGSPSASATSSSSAAAVAAALADTGGAGSLDPSFGPVTATLGRLYLVDLAGSERVRKSAVTGARLKEAQHINKSLAALGDVLQAMDQKQAHIPFRNSKLTHLLQDALGGNARTLMMATVCPGAATADETLFSLQFAARARHIDMGPATRTVQFKNMTEQFRNLRSEYMAGEHARTALAKALEDATREKTALEEKLAVLRDASARTTEQQRKIAGSRFEQARRDVVQLQQQLADEKQTHAEALAAAQESVKREHQAATAAERERAAIEARLAVQERDITVLRSQLAAARAALPRSPSTLNATTVAAATAVAPVSPAADFYDTRSPPAAQLAAVERIGRTPGPGLAAAAPGSGGAGAAVAPHSNRSNVGKSITRIPKPSPGTILAPGGRSGPLLAGAATGTGAGFVGGVGSGTRSVRPAPGMRSMAELAALDTRFGGAPGSGGTISDHASSPHSAATGPSHFASVSAALHAAAPSAHAADGLPLPPGVSAAGGGGGGPASRFQLAQRVRRQQREAAVAATRQAAADAEKRARDELRRLARERGGALINSAPVPAAGGLTAAAAAADGVHARSAGFSSAAAAAVAAAAQTLATLPRAPPSTAASARGAAPPPVTGGPISGGGTARKARAAPAASGTSRGVHPTAIPMPGTTGTSSRGASTAVDDGFDGTAPPPPAISVPSAGPMWPPPAPTGAAAVVASGVLAVNAAASTLAPPASHSDSATSSNGEQ